MASKEINSLRYWYRTKYNLPVNDPRYTSITDEEIHLEYEMVLAAEGKSLKTCFTCDATTHRDKCPTCDIELSGDAEVDDIFARIEAGEKVDLNKELYGDNWEPVVIEPKDEGA